MYDTIAAFTTPAEPLSDYLFTGGSVTEQFDRSQVSARLWRNPPEGEYAPRVTYWRHHGKREADAPLGDYDDDLKYPDNGILKLELSIAKMAEVGTGNVSESDVDNVLDAVDAFITQQFGTQQPFLHWRVQRMDYAYNWQVGRLLTAYMAVLHKLHVRDYSRHPYDVAQGVVWKSKGQRGRWVKFYNKAREQGGDVSPDDAVLRFEISNYRETVRYMASSWFKCEQTVGELLHPGRALYCMAYHWDMMGLGRSNSYGYDEMLLARLRDAYGVRGFTTAHSTLLLIGAYGSSLYSEAVGLMTKSKYYRWKRELTEGGFLTSHNGDDEPELVREPLPALHLPVPTVINELTNASDGAESWTRATPGEKEDKKNRWKILSEILGSGGAQPSEYLLDQVEGVLQ